MKLFITIVILTLNTFAFTPDDIKSMRDFGILVSFNDIDKPTKISKKMTPKEFLNVTYLNFNNSAIYNLPEWITRLTKLKGLDLNGAKINLDELQKIKTLTKLTVLNLSNNNLFDKVTDSTELISLLSKFNLNELSLSNTGGNLCNYLNLGSLNSLIELELAYNNLNPISDKNCTLQALGLNKLKKLEVLDLSNNKISGDFETKFLPLNSLVTLNLAMNNIQNFKYHKPFIRLESLDLSKNSNIKIASNYGGLFSMNKLVQLKRESNIQVPDGLRNRLIKVVNVKKDATIESIMKKLGIIKTHKIFDNDEMSIDEIPIGSILYLKKDIKIPKNSDYLNTYSCNFSYIKDEKDSRIFKKGNFLTVQKYLEYIEFKSERYHRKSLLFSSKEKLITSVHCNYEEAKNIQGYYFILFLKKAIEF